MMDRQQADAWLDLEPKVRAIFQCDDFGVDRHRGKMVIETFGTVRLDMLQELAALTRAAYIEVIATTREPTVGVELEDLDMFPNGLLIQAYAERGG